VSLGLTRANEQSPSNRLELVTFDHKFSFERSHGRRATNRDVTTMFKAQVHTDNMFLTIVGWLVFIGDELGRLLFAFVRVVRCETFPLMNERENVCDRVENDRHEQTNDEKAREVIRIVVQDKA
jgi:hypothetical protein